MLTVVVGVVGILPAVMVGRDSPAVGCLPGGVASREETVEIQRMAAVEGVVLREMETQPELLTGLRWQKCLVQ